MNITIASDDKEMGRLAAERASLWIRGAIRERGKANLLVATGASQFHVLAELAADREIDWSRVVGFHLDEYLGLPATHPASFCRYLKERFVDLVPLAAFHYIDGMAADPAAECRRLDDLILRHPIDVALVGIGENGHLAFNDPPADFQTEKPYQIVDLDESFRRQQWGEGWFPSLDDVPRRAISMSIRQILKSGAIVCSVPDRRKAEAVRASLEGPITPLVPASILRRHPRVAVFLDPPSASLLEK